MQSLATAIARQVATLAMAGMSLLGTSVAPVRGQQAPAVFLETVELEALSLEACWRVAAQAMEAEFGNQKLGVEGVALFGEEGPATISIACNDVGGQTIATVLAAADLSFEETAALRDRLLQALRAQLNS